MRFSACLAGIALLAANAQAMAMPATTKADYAACTSKEYLDDMIAFVAADDKASFNAYVQQYKCTILKAGMKVTVIDGPGMLGGTVSFVVQGLKLWTVRSALDYGQ